MDEMLALPKVRVSLVVIGIGRFRRVSQRAEPLPHGPLTASTCLLEGSDGLFGL